MNCPICQQPMEVYQKKKTYSKSGKEYDHKRFVCRKDDVWTRLEIPVITTQPEPEKVEAN